MTDIAEAEIELLGDERAADRLLAQYNSDQREWEKPLEDGLTAPLAARPRDVTGSGVTVAVFDSAPDLLHPALAGRVENVTPRRQNEPDAHGTLVDLMVLDVAPEAHILHFDVTLQTAKGPRISPNYLRQAFAHPRLVEADVVCLSLGFEQTQIDPSSLAKVVGKAFSEGRILGPLIGDPVADARALAQSRDYKGPRVQKCRQPHACICKMIETAARPGQTFVAAAGNTQSRGYCPALSPQTIAVGYKTVLRERHGGTTTTWDGDTVDFKQAAHVDLNLFQSKPDERTSFAAPRFAGLLALLAPDHEATDLLLSNRVRQTAWQLELQLQLYAEGKYKPETPMAEMCEILSNVYAQAVGVLPAELLDFHQMTTRRRLALQFFMGPDLINMGYHLHSLTDISGALKYCSVAKELMPWAHEPLGIMAASYRDWAERVLQGEPSVVQPSKIIEDGLSAVEACLKLTDNDEVQKTKDRLLELATKAAAFK
ncbi:MAG: S8 family serine peptidase [Paracoccaceae bacterium]|nr:S8 family serine peptidase [Paracoccaceae bacterium]